MTPVTGPPTGSGSFLVFTGEECDVLREVLRLYLAETKWAVKDKPNDVIDEEMLARIARRRAVCERGTA